MFMTRRQIKLPETQASFKKHYISPGDNLKFSLSLEKQNFPVQRKLRVVGETDIFWKWRQESGIPYYVYQSIEDALDSVDSCKEKYSMCFNGNGEAYPRNAYIKIYREDITPNVEYHFEVLAKAENLRLVTSGNAGVEIKIYLQRENRHENDAYDEADIIERIDFPEGSYDWQCLKKTFVMPENTVLLLIRVGAACFHGAVKTGSPQLYQDNHDNIIPPFRPPNPFRLRYNWLGENLSRKEWPDFEIAINHEKIFSGKVFNPIYRNPDFEIKLPDLPPGNHQVTITLLTDYQTAPAFILKNIELLEYSARDFEILALPDYVASKSVFPVFIKTFRDNVNLKMTGSSEAIIPVDAETLLARAGYHVLYCRAGAPGIDQYVVISDDSREETVKITQIVEKDDDGILLSSGDAVFIHQDTEKMMEYLEWYCHNNIGNAVCFRPVYRWCGSREVNEETWRNITEFLEQLKIYYFLMVDGRELPGRNANPPDKLLAGSFYKGRQAHENDGAFCYWGNIIWEKGPLPEPFADIYARSNDKGGIQPGVRPVRGKNGSTYWFFDSASTDNVKEASELFVENLKKAKADSTRHTGPSTLFRYFYQAGYEMLGAEQMYGPEEIILAALRGASKAYGKDAFCAHLALQWSSTPVDTQEHALRYFLSLATCYMQGVKEINLEEGLWRMEHGYAECDRYSNGCLTHLAEHTRFRRFMQSRQRRGRIHIPFGILQGRYDGWRCFGRGNVWMRTGECWKFGPPEQSFDLLKVFYPRSVLSDIYRCPCPVEPQGWYSGTPYGAVDLVPIEASEELLGSYRVLAFLGWNTFSPNDFAKLSDFVHNGGTLLLSRPHLTTCSKRNRPAELSNYKLLNVLLGDGFETATGIIRRSLGSGKVIYFADDLYPSQEKIRNAYEHELKLNALEIEYLERPRGWLRGSEDVNFTVYDWDDGITRTIYMLNINWWSGGSSGEATFMLRESEFHLEVKAGVIETITVCGCLGIMPEIPEIDVISITQTPDGFEIKLQTAKPGKIIIMNGSNGNTTARQIKAGISSIMT